MCFHFGSRTRRELSIRVKERIQQTGFAVLATLMLVAVQRRDLERTAAQERVKGCAALLVLHLHHFGAARGRARIPCDTISQELLKMRSVVRQSA